MMISNPKRRPPLRQVTGQTIEHVTPRVRRIVFGGDTLADFTAPRPGAHIKLLFDEQAASPGTLLENYLPNVLTSVKDSDDVFWWIACEANTMRRMRLQLLNQQGVDKARLVSRGYWKAGASNHPDHDYGES